MRVEEEVGGVRDWGRCFKWTVTAPPNPSPVTSPNQECWECGAAGRAKAWSAKTGAKEWAKVQGRGRAVVVRDRADRHIRGWEKARRDKAAPVPQRLLRRVVYGAGQGEVLPAAVAQEGDHYYLPVQGRMAMAVEVAAVQGIGGAQGGEGLRAALASTKGVSQEQARKMIGGALHIPSARGVAKRALEGIGWEPGGKRLRFADVYSGIGTMALAVGQAAGQKVQYVAAAERWGKARDVLQAAWGAKVNIRKEAGPKGWVGVNVGRVDVAGVTLPCGPVSKLNGSAEEERQEQLDKRGLWRWRKCWAWWQGGSQRQ